MKEQHSKRPLKTLETSEALESLSWTETVMMLLHTHPRHVGPWTPTTFSGTTNLQGYQLQGQ